MSDYVIWIIDKFWEETKETGWTYEECKNHVMNHIDAFKANPLYSIDKYLVDEENHNKAEDTDKKEEYKTDDISYICWIADKFFRYVIETGNSFNWDYYKCHQHVLDNLNEFKHDQRYSVERYKLEMTTYKEADERKEQLTNEIDNIIESLTRIKELL